MFWRKVKSLISFVVLFHQNFAKVFPNTPLADSILTLCSLNGRYMTKHRVSVNAEVTKTVGIVARGCVLRIKYSGCVSQFESLKLTIGLR